MNSTYLKNIIGVVLVGFCLVVFSGGFFNKLVEPSPYVQRYGGVYVIDPKMDMQTSREAPIAFLCNTTTTPGVFLIAYSG